jgi:hypothetical protein
MLLPLQFPKGLIICGAVHISALTKACVLLTTRRERERDLPLIAPATVIGGGRAAAGSLYVALSGHTAAGSEFGYAGVCP